MNCLWPIRRQREIDWAEPVVKSIAAAMAIKSPKGSVNKRAASQEDGGSGSHWPDLRFPN